MNKNIILEAAQEAYAAPSACAELKEAAQNYLAAVGKENEAAALMALLAEAKADVMTPANVAAEMRQEAVIAALGKEMAEAIGIHAEELVAQGAEYCDCPACSACVKLIKNA